MKLVASIILGIIIHFEDSLLVDIFKDTYGGLFLEAIKNRNIYSKLGKYTLYPIVVILAFCVSSFLFIPIACLCIVVSAIGYPIIGIFYLLGLIFLKQNRY